MRCVGNSRDSEAKVMRLRLGEMKLSTEAGAGSEAQAESEELVIITSKLQE